MNTQVSATEPEKTQQPSKPTKTVAWSDSASLPQLAKKDDTKQVQDVYESILWRIDAKSFANETIAAGLAGCTRKSGSTAIAANLALRASSQHRGRVLLIDANWEMPGLLKTFKLESRQGLYDILSGELSPRECEPQSVSENLDILCRGRFHEDQPAVVRQQLIEEMLSEFKTEYNLIIVDLPPAADLRCALPLARQLDGTLLIARFEAVKQPQAKRVLQRLQQDNVTVWGSILNRHRNYVPKWMQKWC